MKNPLLSKSNFPIIDWNQTREHFDAMRPSQVNGHILDLLSVMGPSMALDLADNGGRQGYYMDVLSVARQSLAGRSWEDENNWT